MRFKDGKVMLCLGFLCILLLQRIITRRQSEPIGYGICAVEWDQSEGVFSKVNIEPPKLIDTSDFDAELQTEFQANEQEMMESDKPKETEETESTIADEYSQVKNEFSEEGWLVCESWGNFDEDVPYVEEEIYEILKAAYAEIDFKGEFKKGDLDRDDEYKAVFQKLLQNEAPFLDNETGKETYIKDIPELHYNPSSADHDEKAYRYYFFDIDEDGLPEMGICDRNERANEIFFFKYDTQDGKINLWYQSGGWQTWFGSRKLGNSWGGGQYMEFTEFGSDREEKCETNTFTIYDKENLRMVMAPIYADKEKEIEITDKMKSQGVYDLVWGQWYFRITDEQYHELTEGYWEAYKTAEERIKDVTYTYEELFGSLLQKDQQDIILKCGK